MQNDFKATIKAVREIIEKGSTEQILELYQLFGYLATDDFNEQVLICTRMKLDENNELVEVE